MKTCVGIRGSLLNVKLYSILPSLLEDAKVTTEIYLTKFETHTELLNSLYKSFKFENYVMKGKVLTAVFCMY